MPDAVIVSAARSPIGRAAEGSLASIRPDDLAAQLVGAALEQVPELEPGLIDDLYLGCAQPWAEQGSGLARIVALLGGHGRLPGATVDRVCASSVQTTRMAFHAIRAGEGEVFISAGVDCASQHPDVAVLSAPNGADPMSATAQGPAAYLAMGQTAEHVASLRGIGRAEQDEWALTSHHRAERAIAEGFYAREITPVTLPDGTVVDTDDSPRRGVVIEALSALAPMFGPDGTVTAGNSCRLNDGAAALVVMSDIKAKERGLSPLARIVATGVGALSPNETRGLAAVDASRQALRRAGMSIGDMDLYEIHEAFAAQVLPCADELGMDRDKLNVHGGAIALGHPLGATGARLTTTLLGGLRAQDAQFGLETICVAGGQGMAIIYERLG